MRSTTPTLIAGRYEVGELLGRGGMAEVYAGIDRRLSRPVAIKLLQAAMSARDDIRIRFEAEACAAAAITQPHAVAVYDTGEHEGVPYIVMERLPGDTLADRIATGSVLSAAEARAFGRQVLGALDAAHRVGLIHRDVKPGNILLTADGAAKIADFGIAKSVEVGADLTGTGQLIGTPAYLAPEQLGGDPASPLSDLYALGVVLFEGLTGRKPFEGDNAMVTARAVIRGDHVPLADVRPDLDADLVRVVERAMDPDPRARFSSAAAMAAALAPPAVPTVVPGPGATAIGPDATEILDVTEIAAHTAPPAPAAALAAPIAAAATATDVAGSGVEGPDSPSRRPAAGQVLGTPSPGDVLSASSQARPAAAPVPPPALPPLAGRRRPSREARIALVALAAVAVVFLVVQMLRSLPREDATGVAAGSASSATTLTPATTPATTPPSSAAPTPGRQLAEELRAGAATLGPAHGTAAPELAARLRVVADAVERADAGAPAAATALIVDIVRWRQAGQLNDVATVGGVQLLQKVPGLTVAGSAPAVAAGPSASFNVPEVFDLTNPPKDKGKDDD